MSIELSLGLFTTFMQIAVGLSLYLSYAQLTSEGGSTAFQKEWLMVFGLCGLGLLISILHLGKPFYAIFAVKNLGMSWLSREGIFVGIFLVLSFLSYYTKTSAGLTMATLVSALLCIISQGFTYAATGYPAIDNIYPLIWFTLSSLAAGGAAFLYFSSEAEDSVISPLVPFCIVALAIALVALPFTWMSSDQAVIQETAANWFASPLFWAGIICLAISAVLAFMKKAAVAIFALCALGVFLTRLVFFVSTVHTSSNIGNIF